MPDTATVIALVGAFGVGGVIGVALRAEHERAERRRDRMIAVAEEFLRDVQAASDRLRAAGEAVRRYDPTADEEVRVAAMAAADSALKEAERATDAADAVAPRLLLVFPPVLEEQLPPLAVVLAARQTHAVLELRLTNPAVQPSTITESFTAFAFEVGRFTAFANQTVWRRWYTRPVRAVRRGARHLKSGLRSRFDGSGKTS